MGFVCLVYVCLCMCFWHFFSLCVYLFALFYFDLSFLNLACWFSKERERKKAWSWMGGEVGRIWEEMRKGK